MKDFLYTVIASLLLSFLLLNKLSFSKDSYYLIVDKAVNQLKVMNQEKTLAVYEAGWGLKSEIPKQKQGDLLTPEGMYEILEWRPSSQYLFFIKINYPNLNDLAWGYYYGLINLNQFNTFSELFFQKKEIVSALGAEIGIHGGGAFKEEKKKGQIYKNYNWTKGCISLSNKDLLQLLNFISPKQKVFIINSSKKLYEILEKLVYPKKIKPLEFFEGEVYFKIDNFTYYKFILKKYFTGEKYLNFQEWQKGVLVRELNSKADGTFEFLEEESIKKRVISKIYSIEYP